MLFVLFQAAELAEFTAKIALLEDAKRKKEDEATEWQHKVLQSSSLFFFLVEILNGKVLEHILRSFRCFKLFLGDIC